MYAKVLLILSVVINGQSKLYCIVKFYRFTANQKERLGCPYITWSNDEPQMIEVEIIRQVLDVIPGFSRKGEMEYFYVNQYLYW